MSVDNMIPITIVEGIYSPHIYEKQQEVEKMRKEVKNLKKERYGLVRNINAYK